MIFCLLNKIVQLSWWIRPNLVQLWITTCFCDNFEKEFDMVHEIDLRELPHMYDTRNRLYLWPRFDYYIFLSHPSNYWERISFHASRDLLKYFMACKCRLSSEVTGLSQEFTFQAFLLFQWLDRMATRWEKTNSNSRSFGVRAKKHPEKIQQYSLLSKRQTFEVTQDLGGLLAGQWRDGSSFEAAPQSAAQSQSAKSLLDAKSPWISCFDAWS